MPRYLLPLLALLLLPFSARSDESLETPASLKKTVESFLSAQLAGQPGADFALGGIDPRLRLPRCAKAQAFVPAGSKLWGNTTVGVRCDAPAAWSIYVPVTVKVTAGTVVSVRPLSQGQVLSAADVALRSQDLTQLPPGTLTDPAEAVGKTLVSPLPAGYPLRADMLKAPMAVFQGQNVRLTAKGPGFTVSSEGKAMGNAADGQPVQVRTPSGQVVKGIARSGGVVEIPF